MRPSFVLRKYVPLIKFVGGPHKPGAASSGVNPHPLAPNGILPGSSGNSDSVKQQSDSDNGAVLLRSQLPARFRYNPPSQAEIDNIISGGADMVF